MINVLVRHEVRNGRVKRCSRERVQVEKVVFRYPADRTVKTTSGDVWVVEPARSSEFDYVTVAV